MIPKIIHHIAPKNIENHPLIWKECYQSWMKEFPELEYQHVMWNDDDDIDNLVKNKFPKYWDLYSSFPFRILKVDFSRLCILYEYGGIYADMDMYCYKNFYEDLDCDLFLLQSEIPDEIVQNSLMCSVKGKYFFIECMEEIKKRFYKSIFYNKKYKELNVLQPSIRFSFEVKKVTGPYMISTLYKNNKSIKLLDSKKHCTFFISEHNQNYKTRHFYTSYWINKKSII
jgi:mannosyltransferase OCH1-like enzyme